MVNEFDKEIDAMLRDFAKNPQSAFPNPQSVHLDADEISAFAENALPNKARLRMTEHLADCSNCRKILANFALLNSEIESEIIHEEVKTVISAPTIPWYKSLFAFPNLAYTMGAMALLLVGMVGLLVLQSSNNSEPMVAQSEKTSSEKSSGPNVGSLEGDFPAASSNSNASSAANAPVPLATPPFAATNSAPANSSANVTVSREATSATPVAPSDSNSASPKSDAYSDDAPAVTEPKKGGDTRDLSKKEEVRPVTETTNEAGGERQDMSKQSEVSQNQTRNMQDISPDSQNVQRTRNAPAVPNASGATQDRAERPNAKKMSDKDEENKKNKSVETLSIGGKSFRNVGGVWTDTSYTGGSTKNYKRGSDDYKKLDSGLQNLGNSFKSTVIIVWGGKNYKIQ